MAEPSEFDLDGDGEVEEHEIEIVTKKLQSQRQMAWTAMWSMILFTVILFSPIISTERVDALSDVLGLFYIGQAGVVGAYMGFSAYMNRK